MKAIGRELIDGVKAFMDLQTMIGEVLSINGHPSTRTVGESCYGYNFDDNRFSIGVNLLKPNIIFLVMHQAFMLGKIEHCAMGRIQNGTQWVNVLDMQSGKYNFFERTKSGQMDCIEEFLNESLRYIEGLERNIEKTRKIDIDVLRDYDRKPS